MRELAAGRGTRVHDPEDINAPHARAVLASYRPDLLVVCDYGQILCAGDAGDRPAGRHQSARLAVAQVSRRGADQLGHLSRRDRNRRDRDPHDAAARRRPGDRAGRARRSVRTKRPPSWSRGWPSWAPLGAGSDRRLEAGTAQADRARPGRATRAPRLKKELGQVDWSRSAAAIANQVRALQPWPKTYTFWQRAEGEPLRLILERVHVEPMRSRRPAAAPCWKPAASGCCRHRRRRAGDRPAPAGRQAGPVEPSSCAATACDPGERLRRQG